MSILKKTVQLGNHTLTLETGVIARQASASIVADINGTSVLVTVVGINDTEKNQDFFPLRVDYQEKSYACGKIPGGFFKREGRPSEEEVLTSRIIDRPIRPLFPKGFCCEVQIIATVVSVNPEIAPDIVAMIGASAALALSGMPFQGPMAAARVGYKDGEYILNPTQKELKESKLDLVVAGTESSVLMVESEAEELSESVMLGAVMFGHNQFQPVIQAIKEMSHVAKEPWNWQPPQQNTELLNTIKSAYGEAVAQAYSITNKMERQDKLKAIRAEVVEKYVVDDAESTESSISEREVKSIIENIESEHVRGKILKGEARIDGRDTTTVRNISIQPGILPRTHGSAVFTRGETQALVVTTLGTAKDCQTLDSVLGEQKESFMLHYNFPPYSVGEVGMVGSPKRREIGHGRLAKRALISVMPGLKEFPYVIRVVSEITESNGSSSMATVCGASLALMDAGVPIQCPVAGIAMGLIKEQDQFAILSDILGDEDHLGDMDFKVAGTENGITALQMDIKISGITEEIMTKALEQAKAGRLHILGEMNKALQTPRKDLSKYAPRIVSMQINPEKIKDVIGKGGATIRALIDETGATIDITEDGVVQIASTESTAVNQARKQIELLTADIEIGAVYEGKVVRITEFGAFVNILPGKDGLVHISQIANHRVEDVASELSEGQMVKVKLTEVDRQGRLKLSMKALLG